MHFPAISLKKIFISTAPTAISSIKSYHVIHTFLLSSSLVGVVHSFSLFVFGKLGHSFLTFFLSSGCALGGYVAQRAAMQKTFTAISEDMQRQVLEDARSVKALKTENSILKKSIDELAKEATLLAFQRKSYEQIAIQLQKLVDTSSQNSEESALAIKAQTSSLKEQVNALQHLQSQMFPEISTMHHSSLEELKKIRELFTHLKDPKATLVRLNEIQDSLAQLKNITEQIQTAERALKERIKEIEIHNKILAQHEQAHATIINTYKKENERFQAGNARLEGLTKDLHLNVIA